MGFFYAFIYWTVWAVIVGSMTIGCAQTRKVSDIRKCLDKTLELYSDSCAGNSDDHTYYNGVECGVYDTRMCLEL